jgi:hypothetical protein
MSPISSQEAGRTANVFNSIRSVPQHWGRWFSPLKAGNMKQTNLNIFYQLGASLEGLREIKPEMEWVDFIMKSSLPVDWLQHLLKEIQDVPFPDTRDAAQRLLAALQFSSNPGDVYRHIAQSEVVNIWNLKEEFEKEFEREHHNLSVFTVLPKGIYDTRLLIDTPENEFPETVRAVFTTQIIHDLKQAGRCLAFECPTASAFHTFRATEALLLKYYEVVTGKPWDKPQRDWEKYVEALQKLPNSNKDVLSRLDDIRKLDRNPYTHPDRNVTLDEAPMLFRLTHGVMYRMAEEIRETPK